jgi:hypothetical protein
MGLFNYAPNAISGETQMAGEQVAFDEGTTDPVALAKIFDELESNGGTPPEPAPDAEAAARAAAEAAAKTAEAEAAAAAAKTAEAAAAAAAAAVKPNADVKTDPPAAGQEPDGVATKDGKHIIPFAVLQAEREKATTTAKELATAQARLAELEAAAKAGTPGVKPEPAAPAQPKADDLSADDLATLKEDFPTVYKALMATRAQAAALEAQLKPVQETVQQQQATREQTEAEQVQAAIDATPKLAMIKSSNPELFEQAKAFDNVLKGQAAWQGKPYAERFAKVIELVEQTSGEIVIPGAVKTPPPAVKTQEQLKEEAKAAAAAAATASKTTVPTSLSDFPAGQHAANSEMEAITNMTHAQLAAKFASMTPEQQDAYLNNL